MMSDSSPTRNDTEIRRAAFGVEKEEILEKMEEDQSVVLEEPYLTRIAMMPAADYNDILEEVEGGTYNILQSEVSNRKEELKKEDEGPMDMEDVEIPDPDPVAESDNDTVTIGNIEQATKEHFGPKIWHATDGALAVNGALIVEGNDNCPALVFIGPASSGKTTTLRFLKGDDGLVYESSEFTAASFMPHNMSEDPQELVERSLLPKIKHRIFAVPDLDGTLTGDREKASKAYSRLREALDGRGINRDSAAQGGLSIEGDYRFGFLGATTPLPPGAWDLMGNAGPRLLMLEIPGEYDASAAAKAAREDATNEGAKRCGELVRNFARTLWHEHGGYAGVPANEFTVPEEHSERIGKFGELIAHARARVSNDGYADTEDYHRVIDQLHQLARGRALFHGRTTVAWEDVDLIARIALSTMPRGRRPVVQALYNWDNRIDDYYRAEKDALLKREIVAFGDHDMTAPTIGAYMDEVAATGLATTDKVEEEHGQETTEIRLTSKFRGLFDEHVSYPDYLQEEL